MRLLKLAMEKQRWDLAAHTIVLAAAKSLRRGERPHASQTRQKSRCSKGQKR